MQFHPDLAVEETHLMVQMDTVLAKQDLHGVLEEQDLGTVREIVKDFLQRVVHQPAMEEEVLVFITGALMDMQIYLYPQVEAEAAEEVYHIM
jgi:hypothetical protein